MFFCNSSVTEIFWPSLEYFIIGVQTVSLHRTDQLITIIFKLEILLFYSQKCHESVTETSHDFGRMGAYH